MCSISLLDTVSSIVVQQHLLILLIKEVGGYIDIIFDSSYAHHQCSALRKMRKRLRSRHGGSFLIVENLTAL